MSRKSLDGLNGVGSAYIRVSTDKQDTDRQYAGIGAFEQRNNVAIARHHWFKDENWARDKADKRPEFQRLLRLAESGAVNWIVVDQLDRFGTKDGDELIHYRYLLRKWGVRLFDCAGKEWTSADIATILTAVVEGEKSKGEQTSKSYRVLGGKVEKARLGEWQGGPVRLGFDIVCFHRETDKELWRVVFESRNQRLKVYSSGETERFDGVEHFPRTQPMTEVLRVAPSTDKSKIDAAISVFKRFATESITYTALAHYLNDLGWRNGCGGYFQANQIEGMLEDPIYLGYYAWNKRHFGKFHRYTNGQTVAEENYEEKGSKNDKADWVQSKQLFEPLVDRKTWEAVQNKLQLPKRAKSPRSAAIYLAGLVYCGNCGGRMVAGPVRKPHSKARKDGSTGERYEYFCGTYFKAVREGRREECSCNRNGVFQDVLERYVERWLKDVGQRLELLSEGLDPDEATAPMKARLNANHNSFVDGMMRLLDYIRDNDPNGWNEMWSDIPESHEVPYARAIDYYRRCFSPNRVNEQIAELETAHDALMERCLNLKTERAIAKINNQLGGLETQIGELEKQRENIGEIVEQQWREILDLSAAVRRAEKSLCDDGNLRRRAEILRGVIQRIECTFIPTGKKGGGWGKANAKLSKVTIYPIAGDSVEISADSMGTLLYSSAHSCM